MQFASILVLFFGLSTTVYGHSWLACTDYRITSPTDPGASVYDPAKCKAFPRNYKACCTQGVFGLDHGYDYIPGNGNVCEQTITSPLSNNYDGTYAMASYQAGQKVCLAWPAKNHVAASCINPYIPDNGLKIYVNPTANPRADAPKSQLVLAADMGANAGRDQYKGFQNCPRFCQDPDKCICTGCFTVPTNLQAGSVYTFVWQWSFNGPADTYSNCWEAAITTGNGSPPPTPTPPSPTPPTPTPPTPNPSPPSPNPSPPSPNPSPPTPNPSPPTPTPPTPNPSPQSPNPSPPTPNPSPQSPFVGQGCVGYDATSCTSICGSGKVKTCMCEDNQFRIECSKSSIATISVSLLCLICFAFFLL